VNTEQVRVKIENCKTLFQPEAAAFSCKFER